MELSDWELQVARAYTHYPVRVYRDEEDDSDYEYHSNCDGCLHSISKEKLELCNGEENEHKPRTIIEMKEVDDIGICTGGRRIDDENRGWWWQRIKNLTRWTIKRNLEEMKKEFERDRMILEGKTI